MTKRDIKIFIDFDGTITKEDVGDAIFRRFGDREKADEIIARLLKNEISARQCWEELCGLIKNADSEEVNSFIDNVEIDSSFHTLVNFCRERLLPFYVLSDGFDLYIDRIFQRENLRGITYFSNELRINEEGSFIPSFPYYDSNCSKSANCKRNHIINNSSDNDITVFIGDGNSDKETIQYCDYIFAKDDLLRFCERERISFFPFRDFNDVIQRLEELLSKKNLRKRHQAELKRKEAYTTE